MTKTIEVILSPALYQHRLTRENQITVVVDVLRFTSSLTAAFHYGISEVIPVTHIAGAEEYKRKGFPVAAERDGLKLPFADFGNSMSGFDTPAIIGKSLVYCTTNGTVAMNMGADSGIVVAMAFTNLSSVAEFVAKQDFNAVILCSGWKNLLSIEDTLCAGALLNHPLIKQDFQQQGDECTLAADLWLKNEHGLKDAIMQTAHYKRLIGLGVDPNLDLLLTLDLYSLVPVYRDGVIRLADVQGF